MAAPSIRPAETPGFLSSEQDLRATIPAPTTRITAKIRSRLDPGGRHWVETARLVGLATRRAQGGVDVVARAHGQAVATTKDDQCIRICDEEDARVGDVGRNLAIHDFAGMLVMVPGVESTLRANGACRAVDGAPSLELQIDETYVHCPKAFVRSKLWTMRSEALPGFEEERGNALGPASRRFVESSPFAMLGTCLEDGGADVSPRGDPPGFAQIVDARTLLIPDRPGNRIADSFRNILAHPHAGLLFLIPGIDWALRVSGSARITNESRWLEPLAVKDRPPKLGIWLEIDDAVLEPAPALARAGIWDAEQRAGASRVATAGQLIVQQVEPEGRFLGAKGKVLDWMLARDAKKNLY